MTYKQFEKIVKQGKPLYVKYTNERVLVMDYQFDYTIQGEVDVKINVIFMSDSPCLKAVSTLGGNEELFYDPHSQYSGHPVMESRRHKATLNSLRHLSPVPYGTKAAEVLFGKK